MNRLYDPVDIWGMSDEEGFAQNTTLSVKPEKKRKMNPYALNNAFTAATGGAPESVITSDREAFTAKIVVKEQSHKILKMKIGISGRKT